MPAPVMGGTLSLIGPAPIAEPDPVTILDQGGILLVTQFLEFLIDLNNDNSLKPKLAESWTPNDTLDVWTFKLRQGVTFSDGSPFEAEDVVTTVERLLDPNGGSSGAKSQCAGYSTQAARRLSIPPRSSSASSSRTPTSRTRCPAATTTAPSCRVATRATSSSSRSAPAPSCSTST